MKFNIKDARNVYPQIVGESNAEYKRKILSNYIDTIIDTLNTVKDFDVFDAVYEVDNKKKKGKVIIEFKIK